MVEINIPFLDLETEAENEIYAFIDKYLNPLPKKSDGTINKEAEGFQHNDVDALRHAYVSGVYTMEYGEKAASFLGMVREYAPWASIGSSGPNRKKSRNMDLWNNHVGRKYGKKSKTREELFQQLLKALKNGELIINLNDQRKHSFKKDFASKKIKERVIVLKESKTGENIQFLDTKKLLILSRKDFLSKIKKGEYGEEYEIRVIKGKETPVSKRDGTSNLG